MPLVKNRTDAIALTVLALFLASYVFVYGIGLRQGRAAGDAAADHAIEAMAQTNALKDAALDEAAVWQQRAIEASAVAEDLTYRLELAESTVTP